MNKKSFYNKPIAKVVKIDCVYLNGASMSDYPPGEGTGQQSVPEVPGSTEPEQ